MKYEVNVGGQPFLIEVDHGQPVLINGRPVRFALEQVGGLPLYSVATHEGVRFVLVEGGEGEYRVEVDGRVYSAQVERSRPQRVGPESTFEEDGGTCHTVAAPLAGTLVSVAVMPGESVEAGQVMAVLESMKMQMQIRAPHGGIVERIHKPPGSDVGQGDALVTVQSS